MYGFLYYCWYYRFYYYMFVVLLLFLLFTYLFYIIITFIIKIIVIIIIHSLIMIIISWSSVSHFVETSYRTSFWDLTDWWCGITRCGIWVWEISNQITNSFTYVYMCVYLCVWLYVCVYIYACVHLTLFYISCFFSAFNCSFGVFELFRLGIGEILHFWLMRSPKKVFELKYNWFILFGEVTTHKFTKTFRYRQFHTWWRSSNDEILLRIVQKKTYLI